MARSMQRGQDRETLGLTAGSDYYSDEPGAGDKWNEQDRSNFVKKVFGILGAQLAFTAACVAGTQYAFLGAKLEPMSSPKIQVMGVLSSIGALVMCCVIFCNPELCRRVPTNYIILGLFTVFESGVVSFIGLQYQPQSVAQIAFLTAGLVIALSLYATYTESDFTGCGPILFIILIGFILASFLVGILSYFGVPVNYAVLALNVGMALLACVFIIYDIQLVMGGKNRRVQIGVDDYILAALNLYIDIVRLFIELLQLFGERRN